jgi:hypothetical protein
MKRTIALSIALLCVLAGAGAAKALDEVSPRCFVSGGGRVLADSLGGSISSRSDGSIEGVWHHRTASGDELVGRPDELLCRRNGGHAPPPEVEFSIADWRGPATLDGEDVTFTVNAQDHGEPNASDTYRIVVSDEDDNIVYAVGGILDSGNFQIHPTNPGHP